MKDNPVILFPCNTIFDLNTRINSIQQVLQVEGIAVIGHIIRKGLQLSFINKTHPVGNLLGAGDHQALAFLHGLDVTRGLQQGFMRTGIEPGGTAAEGLHA